VKAKRALVVLAELNRRKVWVDERTANAICNACFHKVPRFVTYLFSGCHLQWVVSESQK
jgi:protein SDA1